MAHFRPFGPKEVHFGPFSALAIPDSRRPEIDVFRGLTCRERYLVFGIRVGFCTLRISGNEGRFQGFTLQNDLSLCAIFGCNFFAHN